MKEMSPRLAWQLFVAAIVFLAIIAYLGDRRAAQYAESETWVAHTLNVQVQISRVGEEMGIASAARFEAQSDPAGVQRFNASAADLGALIDQLEQITADNPVQQENAEKMRDAMQRRLQLMAQGLPNAPARSAAEQQAAAVGEAKATEDVTNLLRGMRDEEERLLAARASVSERDLQTLRIVLAGGTVVVFAVLILTFRTLLTQLKREEAAERSIRKLSAHILSIQDAERRRLARELHDGVGQIFAGLSMELEMLTRAQSFNGSQKESLEGATQLAKEGLSQTRTISYLLHPPMLDEFGLEQAVTWYVEGFAKRSAIRVDLKFVQPFERLPEAAELVLFRVIQEALTNVHRHSGSDRTEITAAEHPDRVSLVIRDFGTGIPPELLKSIENSTSGAGVGIGGMRERVAEMGGQMAIQSDSRGTSLSVSLPIKREKESTVGGDPDLQTTASSGRSEKKQPELRRTGLSRFALDC